MTNLVSVIIPVFNEVNDISGCVASLCLQNWRPIEILLIDDGSTDNSYGEMEILQNKFSTKNVAIKLFRLPHSGPGVARNYGATQARGAVLVFVDADMSFANNFVTELVKPILSSGVTGTASRSEFLANPENTWALCWNIGRFSAAGVFTEKYKTEMNPRPDDFGGIFRAIRKVSFQSVGGFDTDGDYTDDLSLSRNLKLRAFPADGAVFFHKNPDNLYEVWHRASWIGKSKTFSTGLLHSMLNALYFSFPMSIIKGLTVSARFNYLPFLFFKIVYDLAVFLSITKKILRANL